MVEGFNSERTFCKDEICRADKLLKRVRRLVLADRDAGIRQTGIGDEGVLHVHFVAGVVVTAGLREIGLKAIEVVLRELAFDTDTRAAQFCAVIQIDGIVTAVLVVEGCVRLDAAAHLEGPASVCRFKGGTALEDNVGFSSCRLCCNGCLFLLHGIEFALQFEDGGLELLHPRIDRLAREGRPREHGAD
jgi:hypothetical protein